jgi:hypothetical protein
VRTLSDIEEASKDKDGFTGEFAGVQGGVLFFMIKQKILETK